MKIHLYSSKYFGLLLATIPIATTALPARQDIQGAVSEAVDSASIKHNLGVDPEVKSEISADAENFAGNYCVNDEHLCDETIFSNVVLERVVGEYLTDSLKRPTTIETIASRLATSVGESMAGAGWPTKRENFLSVLTPPKNTERVILNTSTSKVEFPSTADHILFNSGMKRITVVTENGTSNHSVDIQPLSEYLLKTSETTHKNIVGRIDASLDDYCPSEGQPQIKPALQQFNWGHARFADDSTSYLADTATQTGISITISDETNGCDTDCITALSVAFAKAISIWRSGCARCQPDALSVLQIGEGVWLDRRAAERLRTFEKTKSTHMTMDLSQPLNGEQGKYFTAPSLISTNSRIVGYEQIDQELKSVQSLCQLNSKQDWVITAQGFLCEEVEEPIMKLTPKLLIKSGPTTCGNEAAACAIPGGLVEITTSNYKYKILDPVQDIYLGSESSQEVDATSVIIHEVGHWFGLQHPEAIDVKVEDVMAGTFTGEKCVSVENLTMLNNAADTRWQFRARTDSTQGLIIPKEEPIHIHDIIR